MKFYLNRACRAGIEMKTLAIILCLTSAAPVFAECAKDHYGDTYCSKTVGGGATADHYGDVYCGLGACTQDHYGDVYCAKTPGGSSAKDHYGDVYSGPGKCLTDHYGDVYCSKTPQGGADTDSYGDVVCQGGCQRGERADRGTRDQCQRAYH